jgi:L-alanine-DL-glutamate epimerase-like enolase superfamily enzyme
MAAPRRPDSARPEDHAGTQSRPSELKITDLRTATVGWDDWHFTIVRIDTNQGLSGYGEVRDLAGKVYALMLKSRILGENPCNVDRLFRKIKQFGHHGRQGGGVSGVEMALMDLAGKAYGVPAYVLAGGTFRDHIRLYCDTPNEPTGAAMGHKLAGRVAQGFTMLKMDLGVPQLAGIPGALSWPRGPQAGHDSNRMEHMRQSQHLMHPFTHIRLTPKGIDLLCDYVAQVRAVVGDEVPIAADHFGHLGIDDCIRLGQALEPYNLAWLEDLVPWQFTDMWVQIERTLHTPVCTGEDIFGLENFRPLLQARAVNVIHPDLATSGGILETKRIGDLARDCGVSMAMHMAGTPISTLASVHCAAASENFIALEHHFADVPFWDHFVDGAVKPLIQDGYIQVPDGPGLGFEINEEAIQAHLVPEDTGYFEPTPEWNIQRSWDRLWS